MLPAEPGAGERVYVLAFSSGETLSYLALDSRHAADPRPPARARRGTTILALAERAEEASGAIWGPS